MAKVFFGAGACTAWLSSAGDVSARPDGLAVSCEGCHYGMLDKIMLPKPLVTASVSPDRVEPGGMVELSVVVEKKWEAAKVAGFAVMTAAPKGTDPTANGQFNALEPDTHNVGPMQSMGVPYALGHKQARVLTDGRATFRGQWVAPATPGSYDFQVFGVVSDDGDGKDDDGVFQEQNDPFERTMVTVGVGCALFNYYEDSDGDGYGATLRRSCAPVLRHVERGGDCDDEKAEVNPGATELCSFTDENCDGDPMNPLTQYADSDGDGFGHISGLNIGACERLPGHSLEAGDCEQNDAKAYPGAPEVSNGKDDNCDLKIDEAAGGGGGGPTIGLGGGGGVGGSGPGGSANHQALASETSEGGCRMAAGGPRQVRLSAAWLAALGVGVAWFRRRRVLH